MGNTKSRNNQVVEDRRVVELGESLDITTASALRERLLDALALNEPVTLDVTSTQQFDTAGLQLLSAFTRSAVEQGMSITWVGQTQLISARAYLLGLGGLLGLPQV